MNEQVKKLLHDAAKHVGRYVTPGNVQDLHIAINEKFAELIIKECTDILAGFDCQFEIETINEHFGVKK